MTDDVDLRGLIQRRLAIERAATDPLARLLANAISPLSPEMHAALAQPPRPASVLLTLIARRGGTTVLFTERAAHLTHHAGQISFPGGRLAPGESPVAAALREAAEEIGLAPQSVAVLGSLDLHLTATGFKVTPVVGWVEGEFEPRPDPTEVASVFEVPLEFIRNPRNLREMERERLGTRFRGHELRYGGHRVWGATAAMLRSFIERVFDVKT